MATKVYVGNLSWTTTDASLRAAFANFGQLSVDLHSVHGRDTGRSRGFGFVTYGSQAEADAAIAAMNDQEFEGRHIKVNLASPRGGAGGVGGISYPQNPPSGGYGGQPAYPPPGEYPGAGGSGYGTGQPIYQPGEYPSAGSGGYGPGYQPSPAYGQGGYSQRGPYPPAGYGGGGNY